MGRTTAKQTKRALPAAERNNLHLHQPADEVLEHCEICRAFDRAPRVPVVGTSTDPTFAEKLLVDLPFLEDITALHVAGVSKEFVTDPSTPNGRSEGMGRILGRRNACNWMKVANGEMRFGAINVRNVEVHSFLKGRVSTPLFSNGEMVLRKEFILAP